LPHFNHWLARCGYAVAAISYRLAPAHQWPAPRDDALTAIAFLKAQAPSLGLDPARFVLLGRSAGGQIALSVGYGAGDPAIRGVIGLYAPSDSFFGYAHAREDDALRSPQLMRQYLGGTPDAARSAYESASAFSMFSAATPPTLLLHGVNDSLVWYRHSLRLDHRLAAAGIPRASWPCRGRRTRSNSICTVPAGRSEPMRLNGSCRW
jgi:acetyl esterase/lipase